MTFRTIIEILLYPLRLIALGLIIIYKYLISPLLPHTCRFYPTCSTYLMLAIREWGLIKGIWLGTKRVCCCRPKGKYGEDYVPLNIKGELKWTY